MPRWAIVAAVGGSATLVGVGLVLALYGRNEAGGGRNLTKAPTSRTTHSAPTPKPNPRPPGDAAQQRPARTSDPIPILMYHVIADPPVSAPYRELYVSRHVFGGQIAWLAEHGYHAVTLRAIRNHWRFGRRLPAKPIVVTFDDGYRSQSVTARPILRRFGWVGVINLTVRNTTDFWGLPPRQVRLLVADGWEVAAHTLTHPDLARVSAERLRREVAGSRVALRALFHVPVDFFCYPSGRLDDRAVAAVRAAGYLGATTTAYGIARPTDMFRLARVRVSHSDGVEGLAAKLKALGSAP